MAGRKACLRLLVLPQDENPAEDLSLCPRLLHKVDARRKTGYLIRARVRRS